MTALRQQMIDDLVLRGLSAKTQEAYLRVVTRLAAFYGRSPDRISEREIQTYLLHLYREKGFSHSTCNVAVAGLRFFYQDDREAEPRGAATRCRNREGFSRGPRAQSVLEVCDRSVGRPS